VREKALAMLREVGIEAHAEDYAATLSGGQRKLLELARALMTDPTLVLLDEPMAGVNPVLGRRLLDYLQRLREERGMTVLFVEHDMDVVMGVSDEVIVMAQGRVIAVGTPEEVRRDPRVIDAYLGAEPAAA
jgi:branched-chain amino acid transport system ATP-binding protein